MANTRRPEVATVEGEVKVLYKKVVEAEERSQLMRDLIREGVGLNEVERFYGTSCEFLRGVNNRGGRQENKIKDEMKSRLEDSEQEEKDLRKRRGKARELLEGMIGRESKRYKKLIRKVKDMMMLHRKVVKKKNNDKVRCLKNKVKRETFKLPAHLERYQEVNIFGKEVNLIPEELKGPVIVGRSEIKLSPGEKKILTRGPKFTIRRILSREVFLNEMMKTFIKERWDSYDDQEEEEDETLLTEEEKNEIMRTKNVMEEEEAKSRQVFDHEQEVLDFAKMRATDAEYSCQNLGA